MKYLVLKSSKLYTLILLFLSLPVLCQFNNVTQQKGLGNYSASAGDNHGPGGVFADLDNDGYPDLVLVTGPGQLNFVYRNVAAGFGNRTFQGSPLHATHVYGATGAIAGDYDNDGDLDIYVINHPRNEFFQNGGPITPPAGVEFFSPNVLYRNNFIPTGSLTFTDVTSTTDPTPTQNDLQFGLSHAMHDNISLDNALTAAWADVDRDGDLDLFVGNHNGWGGAQNEERPRDTSHPSYSLAGQRDILYRNNGNGTFTDITMLANASGYEDPNGNHVTATQWFSSTNAVVFSDLNNDGWIDLFITNKKGLAGDADMTYINRGNNISGDWLGFENVTYDITDGNFGTISGAAMGVDAGDYDNDGDVDLYLTDFTGQGATQGTNDLFTNQWAPTGPLAYNWLSTQEVAARFSWGTQWVDIDNDGWLDIHVATAGGYKDFMYVQNPVSNQFTDMASSLGLDQMTDARGDLTADYNRDGAVDFFIVNLGGTSALFENQIAAGTSGQNYLHIKLSGDPALSGAPYKSSKDAIGARVLVTADVDGFGEMTQMREVVSGNGNAASTASLALEFGLGSATTADISVEWPSGRVQKLNNTATNQFLTITESQTSSGTVIGEVGSSQLNHGLKTVVLSRSYTDPVVLVQPPSFNGAQACVIRLTNVSKDRFTMYIDEAPNLDGAHVPESVSYIVLEAGQWTLNDGTKLEVGKLTTSDNVGSMLSNQFTQVNFTNAFPGVPAILTQVQSNNDSGFVKTRQRNSTTSGFQVAMEVADSVTTPHQAETIGWLAIQTGSGMWNGHPFVAGNTPNAVTHNWHTVDFGESLGSAPQFLASIGTYDGGDGSAIRYQDLSRYAVQIKIEEDTTADSEVAHTTEVVSYLAIGAAGQLTAGSSCAQPIITKHPQSQTVSAGGTAVFSVNATGSNPKTYQWQRNNVNLPGQTAATLTITNVQQSDAGNYRCRVVNACGTVFSNNASLTVQASTQSPFNGTPTAIPGVVQTEAYDLGGQNIAYFDTTPGNTGGHFRNDDVDIFNSVGNFGIGWAAPSEWLEYTVNVAQTGYYAVNVRVATPGNNGAFSLSINGTGISQSLGVPNTGGWGSFQNATVGHVFLTAGNNQILRVTFQAGFNFDWLSFTQAPPPLNNLATDNFSGAAAGTGLAGRTTQTGNLIWQANSSTIFGNQANVTGTTGSNPYGTLPMNPASLGNKKVAVEADVNPTASGWTAVGFANHANWGWWVDGQVWALIRPSGTYDILANGTDLSVSGGQKPIPGWVANGYNKILLIYDPVTRQVELWANNQQAMAPTTVPGGFVPAINFAGFSALNVTQNSTAIDNLNLKVAP